MTAADKNPVPSLPLTPAQRRLWALAQLRPNDPFFSIPFAVEIDGPLNEAALGRALDELVRRHPALRTRIGHDDGYGEPVQRTAPPAGVPSLAPRATSVSESEATAVAAEFAARPFDVDGGGLLRVRLLRLDDTGHRLLVAVHHLVFDGASLALFVSELAVLYETFASDGERPTGLPEPVDYGAYLAARTDRDQADRPENLRYWTERLAGAPELIELPLTRLRRPGAGHGGGRRTAVIPREVVEPLRRLARKRRCSLYMVLKAATDVVLGGYGTTDVLTGAAVSGRDTVESAGIIGYLTRPVVLRADLSDDPTFDELLGRVRADLLDALDHADLPFDDVMDTLGVRRDAGHHPVYQVTYTHQPAAPVHRAGRVVFRAEELRLPTMKTDLSIDTVERADGALFALVDHRTDLLDAAAADLLLTRLRTVLERVAADPAARASALRRPSDEERRRLLGEWGAPAAVAASREPSQTVSALLAERAAATPEAIAVTAGPDSWTHRRLDAAATALAARLRDLGVGPEVPVGVCAPHSFALVAAHLAVWKASGLCVPLDAALPAFQLRLAIADAGLDTVLADPDAAALLDHTQVRVVELDDHAWQFDPATTGIGTTSDPAGPRNAALLLRTAGATGEPLEVVVEHRQLVSRLRWACRRLPADALAAMVPLGSPDASGAVVELFAPLAAGGRLVLPPGRPADAPERSPGEADPCGAVLSPAQLAEPPEGVDRHAVTHAVTVGEPVAAAQVRAARRHGLREIHQLYTAAETAGPCLGGPLDLDGEQDTTRPETAPLGAPADAAVHVLGRDGELVSPGVVGELHIGGAAVTRGYLGRPGLTADRFRPDPFASEPGSRLFNTGDLARHTPDGRLEFVARAEEWVRVPGGARVALPDVRAALLDHPDVAHAAVAAQLDGAGAALLYAAAEPRLGAALDVEALRRHLAERLPDHARPARLELLTRLPSLPGGRLDRAALVTAIEKATEQRAVAGQTADRSPGQTPAPPTDATEALVAAAWEEVLGRPVGPDTGFFDAGGNSLLLIRLRDRLRAASGRRVEAADLFRHPTVRAMSALLAAPPAADSPAESGGSDRGRARRGALSGRARARTTPTHRRTR
ncbi:condensation domain-containing protein [Streptomyces alkaliterrae]|uniref:AMP-binding protein n=1 Tax=Streptomyces alkaliterrae TaxID=2213162 RepID=A0A5P0YLP2_9ACTN|nr:condensation domain-containing protein [Streptomyces alkaliterrae]MBB1257771.1 AMP-binding protein [Streptomyces alkaliterrae]MQS01263.1 AMP-binding protein [Streptomyces alkaliterrae]